MDLKIFLQQSSRTDQLTQEQEKLALRVPRLTSQQTVLILGHLPVSIRENQFRTF